MTKLHEQQKEQLKESLMREIDQYYAKLSSGLEGRTIKMVDIERMLGEAKSRFSELMQEASGEAMSTITQSDEKKSVRPAKESCEDTASPVLG